MDVESPFVKIRKFMTRVPHGVEDIDNHNDPFRSPQYAQEICDYLQVSHCWGFVFLFRLDIINYFNGYKAQNN